MGVQLPILNGYNIHLTCALKYGGDKLDTIKIGYEETSDFHILSVKDNGIGIKDEDAKNMFGLFQRRDTSKGVEGAGLGKGNSRKTSRQSMGGIQSNRQNSLLHIYL